MVSPPFPERSSGMLQAMTTMRGGRDQEKAPYLGVGRHRSTRGARRGGYFLRGGARPHGGVGRLAEPVGEPSGREAPDEPGPEGQDQRRGGRPRPGHHR